MTPYFVLSAFLLVKIAAAQRILQAPCQTAQNIYQQVPTSLAAPIATASISNDYSIELCKNLATAVQSMVLNKLTRNAYRKPVFNQIAGPLLNEIALRLQNSQCPACGNVPVQSVINSIGNLPIQSLLNSGNSVQSLGNVQSFRNIPVQSYNAVQNVASPSCGCQQQVRQTPCRQSVVQRVPNVARPVVNQNNLVNNVQQRYSDVYSVLESLKNPSGCTCNQQRNVLGVY